MKLEINFPNNILGIGNGKKYFIRTYGCQSNVRDSETIAGILEKMGYTSTDTPFDADIILLNTCAIRENAEKKVFGELGHLKKIKYEKPNTIFAVCGCMPQEKVVVEKIKKTFKHVDLIFGTHNIHELPHLLEGVFFDKESAVSVWDKAKGIVEDLPSTRTSNIKAFVNIMFGCNNYCTYCIVPTTRGKQRSREIDDIKREVVDLLNAGYKDITLLGQNVNSWGIDIYKENKFAYLLDEIAKLNVPRLRFTTSNPWDFSLDIIEICKKHKNIMPYFHLPVQSGDNEILYYMNRNHTVEEYKKLFTTIKEAIPNAAFSTDIIVGFPNETDEQFQNTMKLYDFCKYDNAYTFIYSKREGTHAANILDSTPQSEKEDRLVALNNKVRRYAKENNQKLLGEIVEVLVEGPSKKDSNIMSGTTIHNKIVNFVGDENLVGTFVNVKIKAAKMFTFDGELVN
ncbi:hypothetical protein ASO20_00500 [Mycoplasma sp. (ex Biomphalaria glabrata)]|uniref:tRNA (N6-isopentenyl adenosine(37)-C2)-methylthiotransferase MiaB n=1 Tax=Mycoplasma sp. (ex Biomphalaria glabrata) TaxID=1749074 RepID=UPI00073A794D|nr:tRNA (N6-isopentenyl adenosine(37)-C2)-methylthiotransferase MiaB [Mycoplasma sp. (ex Biomphalaria glabrata)]ALV23157.1 hypothetical protein ASO20_00500 [Mycoplasma sp. (ex Biomphalaria glabrata)]